MLLSERELRMQEHPVVEHRFSGLKQMLKSRNEMQKKKISLLDLLFCLIILWGFFCFVLFLKKCFKIFRSLCTLFYAYSFNENHKLVLFISPVLHILMMFFILHILSPSVKLREICWKGGREGHRRVQKQTQRKNESVTEYLLADVTLVPQRENNKAFQIQTGSYLKIIKWHTNPFNPIFDNIP